MFPQSVKLYWDPSSCRSLANELQAYGFQLPLNSPPSIPLPYSPRCASPPAAPGQSPSRAAIAAPTNNSASASISPGPAAAALQSRSTQSGKASRSFLPAVSPPQARPLSASPHFFLASDSAAAPSPARHSPATRLKPLPPAVLPAATQSAMPAACFLRATESPVVSAPGLAPRAPAATLSSAFPAAASAAPPG